MKVNQVKRMKATLATVVLVTIRDIAIVVINILYKLRNNMCEILLSL